MPEGTVVGDTAGRGVQGEGEGLEAGVPSRAQPRRVVPHACVALGLRPQQKYVVGGDEGEADAGRPGLRGERSASLLKSQRDSRSVLVFSCGDPL